MIVQCLFFFLFDILRSFTFFFFYLFFWFFIYFLLLLFFNILFLFIFLCVWSFFFICVLSFIFLLIFLFLYNLSFLWCKTLNNLLIILRGFFILNKKCIWSTFCLVSRYFIILFFFFIYFFILNRSHQMMLIIFNRPLRIVWTWSVNFLPTYFRFLPLFFFIRICIISTLSLLLIAFWILWSWSCLFSYGFLLLRYILSCLRFLSLIWGRYFRLFFSITLRCLSSRNILLFKCWSLGLLYGGLYSFNCILRQIIIWISC